MRAVAANAEDLAHNASRKFTARVINDESALTDHADQMPAHAHVVAGPLQTSNAEGGTTDPTNAYLANATVEEYGDAKTGTMGAGIVKGGPTSSTGNKQAHGNQMPSLAINYCIALVGNFPPRS